MSRWEFSLPGLAVIGSVSAAIAFCASPAWSTPIFKVAAGACPTSQAACTATNDIVIATAVDPVLVAPRGQALTIFDLAFENWNNSLPAGSKWTLANLLGTSFGGPLSDDATLTVTTYRAYVDEGCGSRCGGAEIRITYTPGATDPPGIVDRNHINPGDAVWTQDIITDDKLNPSLPGGSYLDNPPGTQNAQLGPPAYPFQYVGSSFYDKPGRDADAYWYAVAWISTADYNTRTLTLYSGVGWGFTVKQVPEPTTFLLCVVAMSLYVAVCRPSRHERGNSPRPRC